jgi:hypothetical protein
MGYLENWFGQVKAVLTKPSEFFKGMPKTGGFGEPLTFAAINFAIAGFIAGVFSALGITLDLLMGTGMAGTPFGGVASVAAGFLAIIIMPIATAIAGVIMLFIGAVIMHVLLLIVGGKGNYEATFRVLAYISALALISWIPIVGILVSLYGLFLGIVGFSEAHQITRGKAAVAVFIPVVIALILGLLVWSMGLMALTNYGMSPGMGF